MIAAHGAQIVGRRPRDLVRRVVSIWPMMRGGTPNPLAKRAMAMVASSVCAVS